MSIDLVKKNFDVKAFNADFQKYVDEKKETENQQNIAKLKQLNTEIYKKKKHDCVISEHLPMIILLKND